MAAPLLVPEATTVLVPHEVAMFTVNCRRHRPSWMTSGMLLPTGTFGSVKVPSNAVVVETSGLPDTSAPQVLHCCAAVSLARETNGGTRPLGTYTRTFGTGSPCAAPLRYVAGVPATTVPVS